MESRTVFLVSQGCSRWVRPLWGVLLGALLGFILLHPYVMLLGSMGVIPGHFASSFPGE